MKNHSSSKTSKFYDDLIKGNKNFTIFTKDTRYNINKILEKKNLKKYFDNVVSKFIKNDPYILDYGCGPGTFLLKLSSLSNSKLFGVDISNEFIKESKKNIEERKIQNIDVKLVEAEQLPFNDETFDVILIVDVIHHLDDIEKNLSEIYRVLKKNGKILIYEPNMLNPLIWITHIIDRNERGLMIVGMFKKYEEIFKKLDLKVEIKEYNGIVIGPSSKILDLISDFLNLKFIYPLLGFLNPKIFLVVTK